MDVVRSRRDQGYYIGNRFLLEEVPLPRRSQKKRKTIHDGLLGTVESANDELRN